MNRPTPHFNEEQTLENLKHYLPSQAPLKDFIHHNTLHAFQDMEFHAALRRASAMFGYKTYLRIEEYRFALHTGGISEEMLERVIRENKGADQVNAWKDRMLFAGLDTDMEPRICKLRTQWREKYKINLDKETHPILFRLTGNYLDQGIAVRHFPVLSGGFLNSVRELEKSSFTSLFGSKRVKELLLNTPCSPTQLLDLLLGEPSLYEEYLFDQQFAHPGWSGIVATTEAHPFTLLDSRTVSLKDFISLELLLEIDALDRKLGTSWKPLALDHQLAGSDLFADVPSTELSEIYRLWQEAWEWSYYDRVLAGIRQVSRESIVPVPTTFQAMFCIDDRECSLRHYLEEEDPRALTYATPGFFNVTTFFQPEGGVFYTKVCPAPLKPNHIIRELDSSTKREKDAHFTKYTHSLFLGWLIAQTLGFWSAFKLFLNIFKPSISPATSYSFRHMDKNARLTIEHAGTEEPIDGLQVGFTIPEMANIVESVLRSIGMVDHFAPLVYAVGHGASSVNNTHFAGYDCGACSGRPGSVNARAFSYMANHEKVRSILEERGLVIPATTRFLGGLHDTTRDEVEFFDEEQAGPALQALHTQNKEVFRRALEQNARERARRFLLMDNREEPARLHKKVKLRSVSLFEPRPELNHATNTLLVVGRRDLSHKLFLDRRAFMNSYDYSLDPDGKYLLNILKAGAPVCGGINLEYYFSRVDKYKLGAGTKLPHNVIGLIGVANGADGDLLPGLPLQMVEVHDPIRLMTIVEHYPEVILKTISSLPELYEWFGNDWVHLVAVHPDDKEMYLFKNGAFAKYEIQTLEVQRVADLAPLIQGISDNLPVYIVENP